MASRKKTIAVTGVPMDLGTHLRGVDMGPSAIRIAGLNEKLRKLGLNVRDLGNISVPHAHSTQDARDLSKALPFAPPIVRVCKQLMKSVAMTLEAGETPLVL